MNPNPIPPFSYMENKNSINKKTASPSVGRNERRDIHGYAKRLELGYRKLEIESSCSNRDKKNIKEFCQYLTANALNKGRVAKALFQLIVLRRHLNCNFSQAKRKSIEQLVTWINCESDYSAWTKSDAKGWLKRFFKWMKYRSASKEYPFPPEVAWISTNIKRNELIEPEILTTDEVQRMIGAAEHIRDKAYIACSVEGGFRVGEMLTAKIGRLTFDQNGARLIVGGKTGFRPVRLITSAPLLARFIEEHPGRNEPECPLWISRSRKYADPRPVSYHNIVWMVKKVARMAGIQKRIHTHTFRHTAATRDASFLTEAQLRIKYGWSKNSDEPSTYVHLAGRDVEEKIISVYSGKVPEPKLPDFAPIFCGRCQEKNTPGMTFCGRCGSPLDSKAIAKTSIMDAESSLRLETIERKLEMALEQTGK